MTKKEATVADAKTAVGYAKQAGLKVWCYFMLGMYGDSVESMAKTVALSKALPCDIVNFAVAAPYPGTEWGRIAVGKGWLADERWEAMDQNYSAVVDQPGCSREDVLRFQRQAYRSWYLSWRGVKFFLQGWRPEYAAYFWKAAIRHLRI